MASYQGVAGCVPPCRGSYRDDQWARSSLPELMAVGKLGIKVWPWCQNGNCRADCHDERLTHPELMGQRPCPKKTIGPAPGH
jgi:hypothetical protein